MEIDPRYADCVVRRWQQHVGKQATLDGDGRTLEEVAEKGQEWHHESLAGNAR
jgi:hypothetical protein